MHHRQEGTDKTYRCRFLFFGTGYYNYDTPYTPEFPGVEDFTGEVVHPQHWPESLDYTGKRVVVIGSGATAISLIPSLTQKAAHVTMLQRSPTYMFSVARINPAGACFIRKMLPRQDCPLRSFGRATSRHFGSVSLARKAPRLLQVACQAPTAIAICPRATTSTPISNPGTTRGTNGCA